GKLMIGSFGTLAAIASVNFRVHSRPEQTRTFVFQCSDLQDAMEKRNSVLKSVLQPMSLDLYSPVTAARLDLRGYVIALQAGGSAAVLDRYSRELAGAQAITGA